MPESKLVTLRKKRSLKKCFKFKCFYIKVDMKIMRLKNDGLGLLVIGGIKESSDRGYFIESKHQIVDKPDRRVAESSLPPSPHYTTTTAIMSQLLPVQ